MTAAKMKQPDGPGAFRYYTPHGQVTLAIVRQSTPSLGLWCDTFDSEGQPAGGDYCNLMLGTWQRNTTTPPSEAADWREGPSDCVLVINDTHPLWCWIDGEARPALLYADGEGHWCVRIAGVCREAKARDQWLANLKWHRWTDTPPAPPPPEPVKLPETGDTGRVRERNGNLTRGWRHIRKGELYYCVEQPCGVLCGDKEWFETSGFTWLTPSEAQRAREAGK